MDEIEEVSHEMLALLIEKHNYVAVLIYKAKDKNSEKLLKELGIHPILTNLIQYLGKFE